MLHVRRALDGPGSGRTPCVGAVIPGNSFAFALNVVGRSAPAGNPPAPGLGNALAVRPGLRPTWPRCRLHPAPAGRRPARHQTQCSSRKWVLCASGHPYLCACVGLASLAHVLGWGTVKPAADKCVDHGGSSLGVRLLDGRRSKGSVTPTPLITRVQSCGNAGCAVAWCLNMLSQGLPLPRTRFTLKGSGRGRRLFGGPCWLTARPASLGCCGVRLRPAATNAPLGLVVAAVLAVGQPGVEYRAGCRWPDRFGGVGVAARSQFISIGLFARISSRKSSVRLVDGETV